jgi:uncharacterized protein YyaL (SSP411 family)
MPGFLDLLESIADSWERDRDEIESRADQWTAALRDELEDTPEQTGETPDETVLDEAVSATIRSADPQYGGFGRGGPKFPQPARLDLLFRAYERTGNEDALAVALSTLDAMADGGMYDHVGGGFHRYATDREWSIPHFEKMLYDNAELPKTYLAASQITGDGRYAQVAQETLAFVERELTHPDGGFFSTLDAQSEPPESRRGAGARRNSDGDRQEGAFYVWTPDEVREAVDDETTADLFCDRYGVRSGGNFEGGTSVLRIATPADELAERYDLDVSDVAERLMEARVAAFEDRERRPRPNRDEKILAGWNGLMISAFATGARVLSPTLAESGERALAFVRDRLWDDETKRLARRFKDGDVKGDGYLEDYAFLGRGAFDLYQATGRLDHLAFALDLARTIAEEFWDEDAGTLYFTPESADALVTRPQETGDQSTPSSLGVAVDLLSDLSHFAPDEGFDEIADRVLATHADRIRGRPTEHVTLALAAEKRARGALELTIAAEELPDDWWEALAGRYLPDALVTRRPPTEDGLADWLGALDLDEAPPIWADREARDGRPTVYACRSFTCSPPETDIRAALDWAADGEQ